MSDDYPDQDLNDDWEYSMNANGDPIDRDYDGEPISFANPGSALRSASRTNPRNLPCPTCGAKNRLTPADVALGYQCDRCADRDEGLWPC